jgi:hypothetical protein
MCFWLHYRCELRGNHGILLQPDVTKRLLERVIRKLYFMHLPSNTGRSLKHMLRKRFSNWLLGKSRQKDELLQIQIWSEGETLPLLEAGSTT